MAPDDLRVLEIMAALGYSQAWLTHGIVDAEFLQLQHREFRTSADQNPEHYRHAAFVRFLREHPPQTQAQFDALLELRDEGSDGVDLRVSRAIAVFETLNEHQLDAPQLGQFKTPGPDGEPVWLTGMPLYTMLGLVAVTMGIIHLLPKLTRAVPASLVAIAVVTGSALRFHIETPTVVDFLRTMTKDPTATLAGGLSEFALPMVPFNFETLRIIFPYAIVLAGVGLIESLLTLTLVDELTETRGRGNKECVAQGAANVVCGVFGGMGGCAMIGQSMININSGGRGRLSGITGAVVLLAFVVVAAPLIEVVPVAALVGVMFMVVLGTFEWSSLRVLNKVPMTDALVIVLVSGVTVATDLAMAALVGVIVSALVFAWKHAKVVHALTHTDDDGARIYSLRGPLFFGSCKSFLELFNPAEDPKDVIIDFQHARVSDHSAIESIDTLAERYLSVNKELHLRHLSPECRRLLARPARWSRST